jgi:hypothetical protein
MAVRISGETKMRKKKKKSSGYGNYGTITKGKKNMFGKGIL